MPEQWLDWCNSEHSLTLHRVVPAAQPAGIPADVRVCCRVCSGPRSPSPTSSLSSAGSQYSLRCLGFHQERQLVLEDKVDQKRPIVLSMIRS